MAQLLERTSLDDRQRRYVGHVRQGGATLLAVVDDVLDLASIEAGRLQLRPETLALRPFLESVASMHEALALGKGLAWSAEYDPRLPQAVAADPQRLRQVLGNLLGNAVKFTDRGQVGLRVEPMERGGIRFVVHDTGPGIPAAFLPHLFEAFRQADGSARRRHGGTGLGLAIVRRLALAMGGEVHARSVEGAGATFILELPLSAVAGDVTPPGNCAGTASAAV